MSHVKPSKKYINRMLIKYWFLIRYKNIETVKQLNEKTQNIMYNIDTKSFSWIQVKWISKGINFKMFWRKNIFFQKSD